MPSAARSVKIVIEDTPLSDFDAACAVAIQYLKTKGYGTAKRPAIAQIEGHCVPTFEAHTKPDGTICIQPKKRRG